jgi:nucleotide-binding universal stress UspA family protein
VLPLRKILIAVDFSPHSDHALAVALDLAKQFGAAASIIHVREPIVWAPGLGVALDAQANAARRGLGDLLTDAAAKGREAGVTQIETQLIDGVPFKEITRYARAGHFDLIVLGTHGRRGFDHALMGSVAERVARAAPCAVLTVNLPESTKREETRHSP